MPDATVERATPSASRLVLASLPIAAGLGGGLGGLLLALLLRFVQHLAFGYSLDTLVSHESFLQGVTAAPATRVLAVLALCGAVAGIGWWAIYRFGKALISVDTSVTSTSKAMPPGTTTAHAVLQMVTVAMGSPLGREGAPREIGALIADWLSRKVGVAESHRRLLVACGAGAGLAAVYNVPFGGAVFVLEVLLRTARLSAVVSASVACLVGAAVARLVLGAAPQYAVAAFTVTPALVVWAVLLGPVFGLAGLAFSRVTDAAAARAPHDKRLVLWCLLTFSAIGVLAVRYRALLGNGRGPAQLGFDDSLSWEAAATLLGLRLLAVVFALRAGAAGGRLTPSVAMGALLGLVAALGWNGFLPMVSPVAGAIIGAGVFLGAALSMPVTALVLIFEFTWPDLKLLLPLTCAFGSALALRALYRPGSERTASKDAAAR